MLLVFGSINADLIVEVERLPAPGETILCPQYTFAHGGKGANQASAAARAGARVLFAGRVGRDPWGAVLRRQLVADGVDTSLLLDADRPSGTAFIAVDRAGENAIIVASGANLEVRAEQVPDALLGPETTVLCQNEVPPAETAALLRRARARGARTLLNLAPAGGIEEGLLAELSVLLVNEGELRALAPGGDTADRAAGLNRRHGCAVVVTLGPDGALLATHDRLLHQPGLKVAAVDTTGAGDTFAGVLAAALDRGASLEEAVAEATVAGALACTGLGARAAQPARAAIRAKLGELPAPRQLSSPSAY